MANGVGSAAGRSKRDPMPKQIRLNAFDMNCVVHQSPGLWTHPRDRADHYNTLDYWVELAKLLERGKFDALFLADVQPRHAELAVNLAGSMAMFLVSTWR